MLKKSMTKKFFPVRNHTQGKLHQPSRKVAGKISSKHDLKMNKAEKTESDFESSSSINSEETKEQK